MRIDIDRVNVGEMFTMVRSTKANDLSKFQPNTTVANGKATQTMMVAVDWVEDRGSFLYVGYHPVGKDRFLCTFGAIRLYKDGPREFGVIGFEGRRRIIPEEGVVYTNRNGDRYLCIEAPGPKSTSQGAATSVRPRPGRLLAHRRQDGRLLQQERGKGEAQKAR